MGSSGFGAGIQYCERGSFNLLPPGGWKGPYGLGVVCPINDVNCMYCTPPILAASCTTTSDIVCDCPAGAEKGVFRYREKYNMVQDVSYSCQQAPSGGYSAAIWAVGGILIVLVLLSLLRRLYRRWREKSLAAAAVTAATASTLAELSAKLALVNAELSSAREAQSPKALPAQATPAVAAAAAAGASLSSRLPDSSARRSQGQNEVDNGGSVDVDAVAVIQGAGAAAVSAVGGTAQAPSALHAAAAAAAAAAGSSAEVLLPGEIPSFLSDARAAVSGVLVSALNAVAPTLPLAGIAVSAVSAVLRQVEAMRTTSESSRLLAARLVRLRSLVQRAGDDDAFVEAHAALFEGLVATLQRAERALVRINERSRLSSFVMSSSDLERLVVVSGAVTLHLTELTAALQTETLSAVRSLHAAASAQYISAEGISAAVGAVVAGESLRAVHAAANAEQALPPFTVAMRMDDFLFDPPLEEQLRIAPRGSFGVVVFATWRVHSLPVAVKLVAARSATGQAMPIFSWLAEADLMRRLREHRSPASGLPPQHVVTLYGIGVDTDSNGEAKQYLVVMERLQGSLRAMLDSYLAKGRAVPLQLALQWLLQTASGLREVHEAGVVHSDVKAANTLVDQRREAKIGDLGAGRVTRGLSASASLAGATAAGNARGSILWMSSELIDDPEMLPSKQSDVYAWALLCWEVLSTRLPYHGADGQLLVNIAAPKHLMAIASGALRPDLAAVRPDAPPSVVALMQRCWAADPRERPEMAEVAATLKAVVDAFRALRSSGSVAAAAAAAADAQSDELRTAAAAAEAEDARVAAAELAELVASVELMRAERIAAIVRRREDAAKSLRAEVEAEVVKLEAEAMTELAKEAARAEEALASRRRQQLDDVSAARARRLREGSAGLGEVDHVRILAEFEVEQRAVEARVDEARAAAQAKLAAQLAARKEARLAAVGEAAAARRRQLDEQAAREEERERAKGAHELLREGLGSE